MPEPPHSDTADEIETDGKELTPSEKEILHHHVRALLTTLTHLRVKKLKSLAINQTKLEFVPLSDQKEKK
jgi:hypothetical protein